MKARKQELIAILGMFLFALPTFGGSRELSALENEIVGDWLAAEIFIQQPPSNLWQSGASGISW